MRGLAAIGCCEAGGGVVGLLGAAATGCTGVDGGLGGTMGALGGVLSAAGGRTEDAVVAVSGVAATGFSAGSGGAVGAAGVVVTGGFAAGGMITRGAGGCGTINRGGGCCAGGGCTAAGGFAIGVTGAGVGGLGATGAAGRTGGCVAACCCVIAFRTSPGREICERSILVLISSPSTRAARLDLPAADPWLSLAPWKWARTFAASCSSRELECVFFSVTPTSGNTSKMALLLTSNSLARSLIRILLIRPFFLRAVPLSLHVNLRQSVLFPIPHSSFARGVIKSCRQEAVLWYLPRLLRWKLLPLMRLTDRQLAAVLRLPPQYRPQP